MAGLLGGLGPPKLPYWRRRTKSEPTRFADTANLAVSKSTGRPSERIFGADGRTRRSRIALEDIESEWLRCVMFEGYESLLGHLPPIPESDRLRSIPVPACSRTTEILRAVANAVSRVSRAGKGTSLVGRDYPDSLGASDLTALVEKLWQQQDGKCALTGFPFDIRSAEQGCVQDDRVSLDRIDNTLGYVFHPG